MGCWGSRAQHSSAPLHIKNTRPKFHFDWSLNWLQSFNLTLDMSYIFPWSFLKVRLSLQPLFPIWWSSGPGETCPKEQQCGCSPLPSNSCACSNLLSTALVSNPPWAEMWCGKQRSRCSRCHGPSMASWQDHCLLRACVAVGAQHLRGTLRPFHRNPPTFKASTAWQTTDTKAKKLIQQCHASPYLGLTFQALSSPLWFSEAREKIK